MKANRPSLFLYFSACIFVVFFKVIEYDSYVLYTKSIIVPFIFIYYLITNNYKIAWIKALIFLFCFIGDIFNLLNFDDSGIGALLSFLVAYLLLLKLSVNDFRCLKFEKKDSVQMLILLFFMATICITILSLKFEKMKLDFSLYILYGVTLSILSFFSISNFLKKGNYYYLNLTLMCVCFIISDAFFMIYKFYLNLYAFSFISVFMQVFSYLFMATYFVENEKRYEMAKQ